MRGTVWIGILAVGVPACAARTPLTYGECRHPDATLQYTLTALESARATGCTAARAGGSCVAQELALDRLGLACPAHEPTLLARAVVAYETQRHARSQQLLDEILAFPGIHADAAALRARLAIEDGNLPFARRFLGEQVLLSPSHPGLREALGAALYLSGRLPEARAELERAQVLGAPRWRVAYHLGLVEESAGQTELAAAHYREAARLNPAWEPAGARLKALDRP